MINFMTSSVGHHYSVNLQLVRSPCVRLFRLRFMNLLTCFIAFCLLPICQLIYFAWYIFVNLNENHRHMSFSILGYF